ncbi:hypothetical protein [Ensifer sp. LCM 4579]|uniref:hypothetical protein n=1 Tax=Ensifer sp. LCM 4579 TaxID=1848292 RepID=UPI0008D94FE7|nr:hypothetical protein [Ensifer sp. LCM 4579]OHV75468.1 hypothetical protein LCM4579_08105 [Ensifer sp. LCM 4579]
MRRIDHKTRTGVNRVFEGFLTEIPTEILQAMPERFFAFYSRRLKIGAAAAKAKPLKLKGLCARFRL